MNINLISPKDNTRNSDDKINGHTYTVRFKEDILIPKNSKIKMNFATLERESEVQFLEDQVLYIHFPKTLDYIGSDDSPAPFQNILPSNKFVAPFVDYNDESPVTRGTGNRYGFTVPKGFYTFEKLYSFISKNINDYMEYDNPTSDPKVLNNNNNDLYRSSEILDVNPAFSEQIANRRIDGLDLSGEGFVNIGIIRDVGNITQEKRHVPQKYMFDFVASTTHSRNFKLTDDNNNPCVFVQDGDTVNDASTATKTSKIYNSYAIGETSYLHHQLDDTTTIGNSNIIRLKTNKTGKEFSDARAGVAFGLYSKEVATGISGTDGSKDNVVATDPANDEFNRTRGPSRISTAGDGNQYFVPKQDAYQLNFDGTTKDINKGGFKKMPTSFVTVRISAEGDSSGNGAGNVKVTIAGMNGTRPPTGPFSPSPTLFNEQKKISDPSKAISALSSSMKQLKNIRMSKRSTYDEDAPLELGIQTYISPFENNFVGTGGNAGGVVMDTGMRTYYRVLDLSNADYQSSVREQPQIVMYDSKKDNIYFNNQMFYCTDETQIKYTVGTDTQKKNKFQAQIPLSPILFSNTKNFGFEKCEYRGYPKGTVGGVDYDTRPLTIYRSYYLTATSELSTIFKLMTEYENSKIIPEEALNLVDPNTSVPSDRTTFTDITLGWRSISYSIYLKGLPINNFKNTNTNRSGGFSKQILANVPVPFKDSLQHFSVKSTALFQPDNPVVTHLYNQDMVINKFEVEIKRMNDDKDANEIEKSVINFTIIPPDDYDGNVNAIQGFKKLPASIIPSG